MFERFVNRLVFGWIALSIMVVTWGYWIGHTDPHDNMPWLTSIIGWPVVLIFLIYWVVRGKRS